MIDRPDWTHLAWMALMFGIATIAVAEPTHYVAIDGSPQNLGILDSPWDIESAWSGRQAIMSGSTVLMKVGIYRHADRSWSSPGFSVGLQGEAESPIRIRPVDGERVTFDGRVRVKPNSHCLEMWGLEITVSETATWDRQVTAGGLQPANASQLPQGGLNILCGAGCKFINLVIHNMYSGLGLWRTAIDAEMHGCLIFKIGAIGPDR